MKKITFLSTAILAYSLIISSCSKEEEEDTSTSAVAIGDFKHGGIVFWIDSTDNTHGLVCAATDQSSSITWNKPNFTDTFVTGTSEDIGTGANNTDSIIASKGSGTNYAAGLARSYNGGGYNDWFLPSTDELKEMYNNKTIINATASANSGTDLVDSQFSYYWSSTQQPNTTNSIYLFSFFHGSINGGLGTNSVNVRAVRSF